MLESGEKLSKQACDTTNVGEMLFVMDSSEAFICDGESWQTLKGADGADGKDGVDGRDGKDGEKGEKGDKGAKGDSGKNGDNGEPGDPGEPGKPGDDGTSCTAQSVTNAAGLEGLEVTCGGAVVDTIWNGEKGTDGAGCSLEDNGEGAVSVTCGEGEGATTTTIFKAVCGTKPYDPAKSFCSEGELYSCNDKPYDPKKQFCDTRDNQIYGYVTIAVGDYAETWMAENLNYADSTKTPSLKGKSWCYGKGTLANEEVATNCTKYGRLYTWAAAIDSVALANDADDPQTCGDGEICKMPTVV